MPMPSARAASHIVPMAATTEYSAISGMVRRPEAMPCVGRGIGEDRELPGRLLQGRRA